MSEWVTNISQNKHEWSTSWLKFEFRLVRIDKSEQVFGNILLALVELRFAFPECKLPIFIILPSSLLDFPFRDRVIFQNLNGPICKVCSIRAADSSKCLDYHGCIFTRRVHEKLAISSVIDF